MGRDPRIVPPGSLQHVVDVMFQNRFLLRPSPELNTVVAGIIGCAQRRFHMEICAVAVLSSHLHLLVRPRDAAHLAAFMCFLKTNLSKAVARLHGWHGPIFQGRYRSVTVSNEATDQVEAMRYVLSQGVKEGLVDRVSHWPGVHCGNAFKRGRSIEGFWKRPEEIVFSPLPCLRHLSDEAWQNEVTGWIRDIDREAAHHRRETGTRSLGVKKILSAAPDFRPPEVKRSPKRRFHASDPKVRASMRTLWRDLIRAYREASNRFRSGKASDAVAVIEKGLFPEGMFPPNLPFVPFSSSGFPPSAGAGAGAGLLGEFAARGRPS